MEKQGKVLIFRTGALGDHVLAFPALRLARAAFPGRALVCVWKAEFGTLAVQLGLADECLSDDRPEVVTLFSGRPEAGRRLGELVGPIEAAILLIGSEELSRSLLASGLGELLVVSGRPPEGTRLHQSVHLASALSVRVGRVQLSYEGVALPAASRAHAKEVLSKYGLESERFLALHPGSGSIRKNWPVERFAELASRARHELGLKVALFLGPVELEEPSRLRAELGPAVDTVFENPRLTLLASLLAESAVYVGNDSGVSHLAAAVGAPTVAIFGPTDPAVWAPLGPRCRVLQHPSGELTGVGVSEVFDVVSSICVRKV